MTKDSSPRWGGFPMIVNRVTRAEEGPRPSSDPEGARGARKVAATGHGNQVVRSDFVARTFAHSVVGLATAASGRPS